MTLDWKGSCGLSRDVCHIQHWSEVSDFLGNGADERVSPRLQGDWGREAVLAVFHSVNYCRSNLVSQGQPQRDCKGAPSPSRTFWFGWLFSPRSTRITSISCFPGTARMYLNRTFPPATILWHKSVTIQLPSIYLSRAPSPPSALTQRVRCELERQSMKSQG